MSNRLDSATSQTAAIGASTKTTPINPGSPKNTSVVQVEVLAKLNDGTYSVKVENKPTIVLLPPDTKVGDLVTIDPKVINASQQNLAPESGSTSQLKQSASSTTVSEISQRSLLDASLATANTSDQSSITQLSHFSQLIDTLLRANTNADLSINSTSPILTDPSAVKDTHALALELQKQFSNSGVFYESHLADWVNGKRDLQAIRSEPQATLPSLDEKGVPTSVSNSAEYKEVARLVQQQLNTLENDSLKWQGNFLPAHTLELEIRRQQPEKKNHRYTTETEGFWSSIVRFTLPAIGMVSATINMHSSHLSVTIQTKDETTAQLLRSFAPQFTSTLSTLGTNIDQFSIRHDGHKE
ncbi:flagellar hook-length control protein FliK [Undibacterium sp. SXout20W]|uniref:flagellar hook-length control protein FliK n=1 Tax=Undibacterium sp. SXout20W TaxID=3413051 RepID=UPI003BF160C3